MWFPALFFSSQLTRCAAGIRSFSSLLELLNNVIASFKCLSYPILLFQPQRHTAAGAAIADSIEILTAFDQSMYQTALMALLQYIFGFLIGYLAVVLRSLFDENVPAETHHYLCMDRILTVMKYSAASARPECKTSGAVHNLKCFFSS